MLLFSSHVYRSEISELDKMLVHNRDAGYKIGMIKGFCMGIAISASGFAVIELLKRYK